MSNQDDIDAMFGGGGSTTSTTTELSAIYDTVVEVSVVLGTSTIRVRDLLKLGRGAIVELDRKIDDLSDIIVSGRTVGRGEVTIVEDKIAVTFREFTRVNG
ncbi:flagellar motor switch protein FliN [Nitrospirillum iridis]|uniref:Flagellar motor switch protein FliN n=1 Tax=Nitrospirillum iridis TaxID=765888 RepID=A0A7X0EEW8_9PROT|nr:flagellar motor switch protein FliN [Nitrospirillum iridis]MBB6254323.1 flagellar motor switch protein FliN/FliY [Nitrospirillum iridis]